MHTPLPGFTLQPFQPHPLLTNPHVQTLLAHSARPAGGVAFRRACVPTPDGDSLNVDFADVPGAPADALPDDAPIGLLLHGLEGDARRPLALNVYRQLAALGVRPVGMNYRGCGAPSTGQRFYHAGATDDLGVVLGFLAAHYPRARIGIVGYSLGANLLLKYLGEQGEAATARVAAAVAVSPPFDLAASARMLASGVMGLLYTRTFLASLQRKVRLRAEDMAAMPGVRLRDALEARTLRAFDDAFTAPLHGFAGAGDYYARASSGQYVAGIRVPTLLLRALDDPFFDPQDVPWPALEANPMLHVAFTAHGGHTAFVQGAPWQAPHFWADGQAVRFLRAGFAAHARHSAPTAATA